MNQMPFLRRYTAVSILLCCLLHWLNGPLVGHYLHRTTTIYISSWLHRLFFLDGDNPWMIYCDGFFWLRSSIYYVYTYFRNPQSNDALYFVLDQHDTGEEWCRYSVGKWKTKKYRNDDQIGISLFIFSHYSGLVIVIVSGTFSRRSLELFAVLRLHRSRSGGTCINGHSACSSTKGTHFSVIFVSWSILNDTYKGHII